MEYTVIKISCLITLCLLFGKSIGSHFRGGIIMWRPSSFTGDPLEISITIRVAWRRSFGAVTRCNQNTIDDGDEIGPGDMTCFENCAGFPNTIAPFSVVCTDFSVDEDWSTGEKTFPYIMPNDGSFILGFAGNAWINVIVRTSLRWSLPISVNLTARSDTGKINSSPRSSLTPIVRLQKDCKHSIKIPASDPDGDTVRCRWAEGNQECAGVCKALPGAELDGASCELVYTASGQVGWYAVALMIEDFSPDDPITPLSKIPLQFLINVFSSTKACSSKPEFIDDTPKQGSCIGVPVGTTWKEEIIAKAGGEGVSITEINTISPPGLTKSAVESIGSGLYSINVSWTPQTNQINTQFFCYQATDSTGSLNEQLCISLVSGVEAPLIVANSMTPTTEVLPSQSSWKIRFDKEIVRPSRISTYVNFHDSSGAVVHRVDTTSSGAKFPFANALEFILEVTSNYKFIEKQEYYITLDRGIVTGLPVNGQCAPESFPERSPSFWRFRIKDVTPPKIIFQSNPRYTSDNVTIQWAFDEPAEDTCTLQWPDGKIDQNVVCNGMWTGIDLGEGWYSIFINAVDKAGNIAPQVVHSWYVDKTAPIITFQNSANRVYTNTKDQYNIRFSCSESVCSYRYTLKDRTQQISSGTVNYGSFNANNLKNEKEYTFTVVPVDRVGNVGLQNALVIYVDTVAPTISGITPAVSVQCGENLLPNNTALGMPQVLDNKDPSPVVNYTDTVSDGCKFVRTWTAYDRAGNMASFVQTVTISNPQPPTITVPGSTVVPCSAASDLSDTASVLKKTVKIHHPCNRKMEVTFSDSSDPNQCGVTFTRTWQVTDDCQNKATATQVIQILPLLLPEYPDIGQVNVDLQETLRWPQYPSASGYSVYIWMYGEEKPSNPVKTSSSRYYTPSTPLPQDTRMLWQIEYIIPGSDNKPGPIWGFVTRAYPDLVVSEVTIPDFAYSGQTMEVQWVVQNKGGASTSAIDTVKHWYDAVYIGPTKDIADARRAARIRQNRVLDAKDGYTSTHTFDLEESEIGVYYVFVRTDMYNYVRETDTSNNQFTTLSGVTVRLTPPPNLKVTSVKRPDGTFSGQTITVSYTITNAGSGPTKVSTWHDMIYLSKDDILDNNDDLLSTLYHRGSLEPGQEYTQSKSVYIDHRLQGPYHILVKTDVYGRVYEHANENDNVGKHSEAMQITLTPPPDLIVTKIEGPASWNSGDTVALTYTVSNEGGGATFEPWWTDTMLLINTATGSEVHLLSRNVYMKLDPVENYKYTLIYIVPPSITSGQYKVRITTDSENRVFEFNNENNNEKSYNVAIKQQLPDLVVSSFEVSSYHNETSGYLKVNYTIENKGQGITHETGWADQIRIGKDNTFERAVIVGSVDRNSKLAPGNKYTITDVTFTIPEYVDGSITAYIQTDYSNRVTETNNNNNQASKTLSTPTVLADLATITFGIKENLQEVVAGNNVSVYWSVVNKGNKQLVGKSWTDSISLVALDDAAASYKFYDIKVSEKLAPGAQYDLAENLTVPLTLTGSYKLVVTTNSLKTVPESNITDNTNSVPLSILSPPTPDLIVKTTSFVYNVETKVLSVKWTAVNDGNSMEKELSWVDSVYLSAIAGGTSAHKMANFPVKAALSAQQSYDGSVTFVIPNNIIGEFYVHVALDTENDVMEINGENNNIAWSKEKLILKDMKTSDVKITIKTIPSKFVQGQEFNIEFTVQNIGTSPTLATSWTDAIYIASQPSLSLSEVRSEGFKLAEERHTGSLGMNEEYVVSKKIIFPYGVFLNDVYIYIISDENGIAGLRTPGSNDGAVAISVSSIIVEVGPLPDITFLPSKTAFNIVGGEPFSLNFNISNIGESQLSLNFYCVLYLSIDTELDPFDMKLNNTLFTNNIPINGTSSVEFLGTTPFDQASGVYYFLVVLDSRNDVYEISEDNNVAYFVVNMMETVSTDLVLRDVKMESSGWTYNKDVRFDWKLRNNGSVTAVGYKCDTAYMSTDQSWDLLDTQVGKTVCNKINISPYLGSAANDKPVSLIDSIPLLIPDNYFGIVRTRSNIKDPSLENNLAFSQNSPLIDLPMIKLDTRKSNIILKSGESVAYVIPDVPIDETLIILVTSVQKDAIHDVYARYEVPATAYQFDSFSSIPLAADQEVTVENTDEGRYFILVQNNGNKDSTISIEAKLAKFEIRRTSPSQLSNRGLSTVVIEGTLFSETVEAKLKTSYRTVSAEKIYRFGSTRLYAQFDVSRFIPGSYLDVYIRDKSSGAESEKKRAIRMVYGKSGVLTISTQYPASLRTFETSKFTLNYQNTGDGDKIAPLLSIATSGPGVMKIIDEGVPSVIDSQLVLGIPLQGPAGIIPASEYGTLSFEVSQTDEDLQTGTMEININEVPMDLSDNLFLSRKQELRPYSMPNDVWDFIWANFEEFTGKTMKTLRNRISEVATSLSLVGRRVVNVSKLVNWFLQIADGQLAGDELIKMVDIKDNGPTSGLSLHLQRDYSSVISKRRRLGPFGYGWINHLMEMELLAVEKDTVLVYDNREDMRFPKGDISLLDVMTNDERSGKVFESNNVYTYYKGSFVYVFDATSRKLNKLMYSDGSEITLTHSVNGQVKEIHHSNGQDIVFQYNDMGLVAVAIMTQFSGKQQTAYYEYDSTQKTLQSVTVENNVIKYSYTSKHDLIKITYSNSASLNYDYTSEGYLALIQGIQANGIIAEWWEFEYLRNGRAVVKRFPNKEVIEYVYDERKALLATLTAGMPSIVIRRSPSKVQTVYADQVVLENTYNEKKNIYYIKNGAKAVTSYELGDQGEVKKFTDPNGNIMTATYTDTSRLSTVGYPDNSTEVFSYNSKGYVTKTKNRNDADIKFEYDSNGYMVGKTLDGTSKVYNYDSESRITSASQPDSNIYIEYDTSGRPTKIQHGSDTQLIYTYNERNQRTSVSDGKNFEVQYLYDDHYRLQEVKMIKPNETSILKLEYNPSGYVTKRTNGNGATSIYTYAPSTNWMTGVTNYLPDGTVSSDYKYTYDKRGRPVAITTHKGVWKHRFDKASQLMYWETPGGKKIKIGYDKNGNRVKKQENEFSFGYEINNLNQYTSYSQGGEKMAYDRNGNMIRNEWLNGSFVEYQYDSENKVTGIQDAINSCVYKYDALENLQEKKCTTHTSKFYVDPFGNYGSDIVIEMKNGKPIYYVQGLEHGLAAKMEEGKLYYYQFDGQGSVSSIQNEAGALTDEYLYDPFGNVYESRQSTHNEFLFGGQWGVLRQGEIGDVYWMRTRLYDARNGRYLSPDRIGLTGKSTNLYTFALNNPVVFRDPDGKIVFGVVAAGAIIGAVTNSAIYAMTNRGESFSWGGLAGAAVSGGITGAGVTLGAPLGTAAGVAVTTGIGALGGAAGYATTQGINGEAINTNTLAYEAAFNGIMANFPTKMLGWKQASSEFGERWFTNPSVWRSLFTVPESGPLWKSLTAGNLLASLLKFPSDFLKNNWPLWPDLWNGLMQWIQSRDPNDMIGPTGHGDAKFVSAFQTMEYTIRFENDENATAPAQRVYITHTLDSDLDIRTFKLGSFGFGDTIQELDFKRAIYQDVLNFTEEKGFMVRVRAGIDVVAGKATWELQTIDPLTGEQPVDPSIGFLPPNNGTTGQGYVTFSIRIRPSVVTGSVIDAQASIIFDINEPIDTPPIFNTVDNDLPAVNVSLTEQYISSPVIKLDAFDFSSGVKLIDLYLKNMDNSFDLLVPSIKEQYAVVPVPMGSTYKFVATGEDFVGNRHPIEDETVFAITFPHVEEPGCVSLNNCSNNGNCSQYGFCECQMGWFGLDCSSSTPITEPPILEASALPGIEDMPVAITLNTRPASGIITGEAQIKVTNFTDGTKFSKGLLQNRTLLLKQKDFGSLILYPLSNFAGEMILNIKAEIVNGVQVSSREGSLVVSIKAKADKPAIKIVGKSCYYKSSHIAQIQFDASLNDTDGSEELLVYLNNVPIIYEPLADDANQIISISNRYVLTNSSKFNGIVRLNLKGNFSESSVTVEAVAVEKKNMDQALSETATVIKQCEGTPPVSNDECASQPCQNGGTCFDDIKSYVCRCTVEYQGTNCETKISTAGSSRIGTNSWILLHINTCAIIVYNYISII